MLVTLDHDFGELAVVHGLRHSGIIRIATGGHRQQADICLYVLERYAELEAGALIIVEEKRTRVRLPGA